MHGRRHEQAIQRWFDGEAAAQEDPRGAAPRGAEALTVSCEACARLARELREIRALCRAIPEPGAPRSDLAARVLHAIRRGEAQRVAGEFVIPMLRRTAAIAAATLALTALLALYRLSGPATRSGELSATTSQATRVVREVVTRHVIFHEMGGGEAAAPAGPERK